MNIANKLTLLRVILVFVFMGVIWLPLPLSMEAVLWLATAIFIIASLTDFLDGYLARKLGLVTNLGKFMDPLADKMVVTAAMIAIIYLGLEDKLFVGTLPSWIVVVILLREFAVSGLRLVAAGENIVLAAGQLGKWKTTVQMIMIVVYLLPIQSTLLSTLAIILAYLALALTLISGGQYLWQNRQVFVESK